MYVFALGSQLLALKSQGIIALSIVLILCETARAQGAHEDTYFLNSGSNGVTDGELGEIAKDVGGQIPIGSIPSHLIFDYDALDTHLSPDGITIDASPIASGTTCAWFLDEGETTNCGAGSGDCGAPGHEPRPDYGFQSEMWRVNGAVITFRYLTQMATPPPIQHVFFTGPGGGSNAWKKNDAEVSPDICVPQPGRHYPGRPLELEPTLIKAGHLVVRLNPTYGHSLWSLILRMNDVMWMLRHPADFPQLGVSLDPAARAYCFGGSWGALFSNNAALFDPQTVTAAYSGGMMVDFGYNVPQGGWRKLNGHRDAAMGTPVWITPPRSQSWADWFAIEQMGIPGDFFAEDPTQKAEMSAFALLERVGTLKPPLSGVSANVDRHFNFHWYKPTLDQETLIDDWKYYQFMGHSEPDPIPGENEFWWEDGATILSDLLSVTTNLPNDPLPPAPPHDPYPDPYDHTFSRTHDVVPFGPQSIPFITSTLFYRDHFAPIDVIGQGVFPGNLDSMIVGDIDGDNRTELVFGNFEGFIHVMEVVVQESLIPGRNVPVLREEWRSPPLGWGISTIDIGTFPSGQFILAADSAGHVWKSKITGIGSYQGPTRFVPLMQESHTGGAYLAHLRSANFRGSNEEVVVQDQFQRWVLFNKNGLFVDKTLRTQTDPSRYTGMTGKPEVVSLGGRDHLLLPSFDGFVKRLSWDDTTSELRVTTYTHPSGIYHLAATLSCCLAYDFQGDKYRLLVGAKGDDPLDSEPDIQRSFVALYEVDGDEIELLDTYQGPEIAGLAVTIEWLDESTGSFVVASKNQIGVLEVSGDSIGSSQLLGGPPVLTEIPSVPPAPAEGQTPPFALQARPELCSVEVFENTHEDYGNHYIYASTPSGRIFCLEPDDLEPARRSDDVDWPFVLATPNAWPSNHTLGWTFGVDDDGSGKLSFLDGRMVYADDDTSIERWARVGEIDASTGVVDEIIGLNSVVIWDRNIEQVDLDVRTSGGTTYYEASREVGDIYEGGGPGGA